MDAKTLLRQVAENPQHHTKALTTFKEVYEGLQIGAYSNDVLEDVVENATANVAPKFKAIASEQLDKSGITSPLLKSNLLKGCDEVLNQFELALSGLYDSAVEFNKKVSFDKITKTQMQVAFIGIGGNCNRLTNERVKMLEIGIGAGFTTACNKSIDFEYSKIRITPSDEEYFIYAKWPRVGGNATLVAFNTPQQNTDKDFYILWQSGTFNQIKF